MKTLNGCFIIGTDTGVGKTFIGSALTQMLHASGLDVQPRKPLETGCHSENDALFPADGSSYHEATAGSVPLSVITPYRFATAASPERAARLSGTAVSIKQAAEAVRNSLRRESFIIVEGAGGFYSPLCSDGFCADLARELQLPILLVAEDRLGCLNHILLTLKAVEQCRLHTIAVVLNRIETSSLPGINNAEDLPRFTACPVFQVTANPAPQDLRQQLLPIVNLLKKS